MTDTDLSNNRQTDNITPLPEPDKPIDPVAGQQGTSGSRRAGNAAIAIAAFVVIVAGMREAAPIIVPFLLSVFIAIITAPIVFSLRKRGLPSWLALSLVLFSIVGAFSLVVWIVGGAINDFRANLPAYQVGIERETAGLLKWARQLGLPLNFNTSSLFEYADPNRIIQQVSNLLAGLGAVLSNSFLIFFTVIFMLTEASSFPAKLKLIYGTHKPSIDFSQFLSRVENYMKIKTVVSLATGLIITLWLSILQVDHAVVWGLLAFFLNYVPNIGSIIAAVPAVLLTFVQLGLTSALLVAGGFLTVNTIMGNIVEPRYMGRNLGLSTLVVFLSLIFWGWVLGPVGMLLSVPLTMTAKIALDSQDSTRWIAVLLDSEKSERLPRVF